MENKMTFKLRDYQEDAVQAILNDLDKDGNSLVVLPTGSGKSIVIAEAVRRINKPSVIIQPSKEILEQNADKLSRYVPKHEIGIYSASFGKKQIRKFTFGTIQSMYKRAELFKGAGLVLIDEADLVNIKKESSMFTSFLNAIGLPKVFGLTATPYRNMQLYHKNKYGGFDSQLTLKLINRVKPDFWKRIIFNVNNQELFADGYLCSLKYFDRSQFDHTEIKMNKSRTDFDTDNFAKKMEKMRPTILDLVIRASRKMKSVLVFCSSISEAYSLAQVTPNSAFVDGKTPKKERDDIINGFRDGRIKVVYNVGVLTVGFDHPELDCIFLLRPTRSLRLHYQMIGRGIRIAEGKEHCVVVDFTSNVKNLGRIETIELKEEKRMFDYRPMWYLKSETSVGQTDWHGRVLYSFSK
jgi:DNA repair protein RadD